MKTEIGADNKAGRLGTGAATIYDVARLAGVSSMTVSRVVNAENSVRAKTREAVQEAIRKLQFRPNKAARSLAGADELRIGLLYNNPSVAYFTEFLMGALDGSGRYGAQLVVDKCKVSDPEAAASAVRNLVNRGISGMVLTAPVTESSELITELKALGVGMVAVGAADFRGDISRVGIDDFRAAYEMTKRLLDFGHERVGFICGHPQHTASLQRKMGFEAAMQDGKDKEAVIVQGYNTYRSGIEAGEMLLSGSQPPTAVFASNDDMASGLLFVAHRKGIDVPRELSIAGFDDTIAASLWPALTTVRQPIFDIASAAIDVIVQNLSEIRAGHSLTYGNRLKPHQLVERESIAPPCRLGTELRKS